MKRKIKIYTTAIIFAMTLTVFSCNSGSKQEKAKYQCPMKCEGEKTYDKPGNCPVCEMELEVLDTASKTEAADSAL